MASKSKTKGNNFERECVNIAKEKGIEKSVRAYASDGRSLGQSSECDIMINVIRQDRKPTLILISYIEYLEYIK